MIYTIPCSTGVGCSCGEPIICTLCNGYTDLVEFAENYGFPTTQTPNNLFPFTYSGADMDGISNWKNSDVISTGGYLVRASCGGISPPNSADVAIIVFDGVIKQNCTVTYEYFLQDAVCVSGGKHQVSWMANVIADHPAMMSLGTWSSNFSDTLSYYFLDYAYHTQCQGYFPVPGVDGLPQTKGVWRTRVVRKQDDSVFLTDGDVGPIETTKCWIPLNGHLALTMGPGVRVRNIRITI